MNELNFSMLEILAESETHSLRDDGFVPDIEEHARKVYRDVTGSDEAYEEKAEHFSENNPGGKYIITKGGDNHTAIIFYVQSEPVTEAFVRGHEETHVLHAIGQIELLQQRLAQKGLDIDLGRYANHKECSEDERELVANIGALYVLDKNGIDIAKVPIETNPPDFEPAIRLYQEAIKNRTVVNAMTHLYGAHP